MQNKISESTDGDIISFKTGGTTMESKTIRQSVSRITEECKRTYEALKLGDDLIFISTTTPEHRFGYTLHYLFPQVCGYKSYPERINYPEDIKFKNAVLITTPSFLEAMRKYNEQPAVNPEIIITAGAKLQDKTYKYALTIAKRVIEIYGSTETGTIGYREHPDEKLKLLEGVKILESCSEYTKIDTKYSLNNPVILSDRIKVSGNEIEFEERCGRILKIQEKRIDADTIEKEILNSGYAEECYCFEYNEKLAVLAVVNKKGAEYLISNDKLSLTKLLKNKLVKKFEIIPQKWKFTDEIPKKENGKIDRKAIENLFRLKLSLPLVVKRKRDKDFASFTLCFLNNSNFFKGHFDNFPILPGVVQLFWANFFTNIAFKLDCHCGQLRKIKFSNIIRPAKIIELELTKTQSGINYIYKDENRTYSSGLLPLKNIYEEIK